MRIYDLEKSYNFEGLLIIEVDGPLFLYGQSSLDQQFEPSHEFLGRFRKVRFDGRIAKEEDLVSIPLPPDSKVAVDETGKVYVVTVGGTYVFDGSNDETMMRAEFPADYLGDFNTATSIHIDDFNNYMDTFKVDKPKSAPVKKTKVTRLDVLEELLEDDEDEGCLKFE